MCFLEEKAEHARETRRIPVRSRREEAPSQDGRDVGVLGDHGLFGGNDGPWCRTLSHLSDPWIIDDINALVWLGPKGR